MIWPGLLANENLRGLVFDVKSDAAYTEFMKYTWSLVQ
jgi:hypothetical protein